MKILIVTGIYPPEIGGPAQYAKNLKDVWAEQGHQVSVKVFGHFQEIPWGVRHVVFLLYILPSVILADRILTLDAFSAGVVVVASKLFGKKVILRTGGDALWELYVERTGDLVLLRDFYETTRHKWSKKEKLTFYLLRWALRHLSAIVWSTEWQKEIFMKPYGLERQEHFFIENYYGPKLPSEKPEKKNFVGATRKLKWKNAELVAEVFKHHEVVETGAFLDTSVVPRDKFMDKVRTAYAVVLASLGDISPNTILDAIRHDKPFIITKETGLYERIKDCAVFVDPQSEKDLADKVIWLTDDKNYALQRQRVINFTFTHTWEEMAEEYLDTWNKL